MKLLVLTYSTGEGHNSAAVAIANQAKSEGHEVKIVYSNQVDKDKKELKGVDKFYNKSIIIAPVFIGTLYKLGAIYNNLRLPSPIYLMNKMGTKKLYSYIIENQFDAIISTHLYTMEKLSYLKKKYKLAIPCYFVLTDYGYHPFANDSKLDGHFVSHSDVKNIFVKKGIPANKITITGIPVDSKFALQISKEEARIKLNIPLDKKMYMAMSGAAGCKNIYKMCKHFNNLLKENEVAYILVGRNDNMYNKIMQKYTSLGKIIPVKFTTDVNLYMKACDVIITKPGGLSTTESAVSNIPLVHLPAQWGCEKDNALLFERNGLSKYASNTLDAVKKAQELVNDSVLSAEMIKNQHSQINVNAAHDIINNILNNLNTNEVTTNE